MLFVERVESGGSGHCRAILIAFLIERGCLRDRVRFSRFGFWRILSCHLFSTSLRTVEERIPMTDQPRRTSQWSQGIYRVLSGASATIQPRPTIFQSTSRACPLGATAVFWSTE